MKKIILSSLSALSLTAVSATALEIYEDSKGQLFSSPAQGRTLLSESKQITILDEKSPEFLLGKQTHINMKFVAEDDSDMWLKAGVRIQGTFEKRDVDYEGAKADTSINEAYLRRVRFEVAAGFNKWTSFTMDLRNDKANYEDKGEEQFNVGDAYVAIKKPFDSSLVNFKLFRAKIDVSRTETVKSARVIHYDRPQVADEAAQYITHNRRGTNAQIYGDWKKKVHYQVAFGDGVYSGKLKDASGASFNGSDGINQKTFFYGGKLLLSPFDGWEESSRTETYFAQGKHFEVGAGYWVSPEISYSDGGLAGDGVGAVTQTIEHTLINLEISAHYKGLFAQAEYFKFDGVIKDWGSQESGKSNGWYATGEYVIEELEYLAPFLRYESWDKFEGGDGYDFSSTMAGVNWYLQGNSIKAGLVYQEDKYGEALKSAQRSERRFKVTTQFFF